MSKIVTYPDSYSADFAMASEKRVIASGLESDSQSTRRRNVPSSTSANGDVVNRVEIDDKKTQIKKVSIGMAAMIGLVFRSPACANLSTLIERANITRVP
jgi:hypothetical protein